MAYQTGSVQNTYELYDAFAAWLTGSAGPGWNLQATTALNTTGTGSTSVRDKVFWSSGSDGNKSLTVRGSFLNPENFRSGSSEGRFAALTSSLAISKRPYHVENVYDYVTFTGYLNWGPASGSGTSSYGIYGPALQILPRQNTRRDSPNPIQIWNYTSSVGNVYYHLVNDNTFHNWTKTDDGIPGGDNYEHGWNDVPGWSYAAMSSFDGRRRFYGGMNLRQQASTVYGFDANDTSIVAWDMANGNAQGFYSDLIQYGAYASDADFSLSPQVLVHDSGSQDDFLFYITEASPYFNKVNLRTGVHTNLSMFVGGVIADRGWCTMLWDGDDHIYSSADHDNETWSKYKISTDTWTALTNLPANNEAYYHTPVISNAYIPSTYSGLTMTNSAGNPTDAIFLARANGGTTIERYNVNGDEWNHTGQALTLPDSKTWDIRYDKGWWDSEFLWFFDSSAYTLYKTDLSGSGYGTWTTHQNQINGDVAFISGSTNRQMVPISNTHISKIRGSSQAHYLDTTTKMNYWFQGDQDSVNIVTEPRDGRYFWSHFGTYDSLVSTNTMKSTAAFSSGSIVTVPVDSTTGFVVGQEVIFADVSGSATVEKNQILEVVNSTSFKVTNLANSFSSGTLIGTDPHRAIVTGDSFMAGASLDGGGYQSDDMGSTYRVIPSVNPQLMRLTNKNAQGFYTPWPLMMYNSVRDLNTYQAKGMLKNCWVIKNDPGSYPSLVSGDSLNIAGTSYKVFPLEETTTLMSNEIDRLLLLIKTE